MSRSHWLWAHTISFLTHGAYTAGSAVAFMVSRHESIGNFEERNDQCDSACVVKAWGSSALVSQPPDAGASCYPPPRPFLGNNCSTANTMRRPCSRGLSVLYSLALYFDGIEPIL